MPCSKWAAWRTSRGSTPATIKSSQILTPLRKHAPSPEVLPSIITGQPAGFAQITRVVANLKDPQFLMAVCSKPRKAMKSKIERVAEDCRVVFLRH